MSDKTDEGLSEQINTDSDNPNAQDGSHTADDGTTTDGTGGTEGQEGLGGTKVADDKGKEGDGDGGEKGKETDTGAPESYEDFTLPEGSEVDKAKLEEFTPLAKELNLSQDNAQKLVDYYVKTLENEFKTQEAGFEERTEKWLDEAKKDKEYGGSKFSENLKIANSPLTKFFSPSALQALAETGLNRHPEIIRGFFKIGKAIGEDSLVTGKQSNTGRLSDGEVLFGGKGN